MIELAAQVEALEQDEIFGDMPIFLERLNSDTGGGGGIGVGGSAGDLRSEGLSRRNGTESIDVMALLEECGAPPPSRSP